MKILTIIPARKGSKGVKGKNKKFLSGKPLIEYTFEFANELSEKYDVFLSTDDEEIIRLSEDLKILNNGLRPSHLSSDSALTIDVIKHEISILEKKGLIYDAVLLLQPTCPLRSFDDFKKIENLFFANPRKSVVSVKNVDGYHPLRMKKIEGDNLVNYIDQGFEDMRPRQQLPDVYIRNGSIYLTPINEIKLNNSLVTNPSTPFIMSEKHSVNIDNEIDFLVAESLIS